MKSVIDASMEVLPLLASLKDGGVRPAEAKERIRRLQERHPGVEIRLIWDEEPYDGSVHYDALLRIRGGGTVSLAYCADRGLPWPLRGVQRWSDADVLRVNGTVLRMQQAAACVDFLWTDRSVSSRLIDVCLIQEELTRDPVIVDDAALQHGMDAFRRAQGLCGVDDTLTWLASRGMTQVQLERLVVDNLAIASLRDRVAGELVEEYFRTRQAELEVAELATIECRSADDARCAYGRISAGEVGFLDMAQELCLASPPRARLTFESIRRRDLEGGRAEATFAARTGDVLAPAVDAARSVTKILGRRPARLDDATRATIKEILFEDWLAVRRRESRIEWYWGSAACG